MSYIYLASPYSSHIPEEITERYHCALVATQWLLRKKRWVYSPIVHCHVLAATFDMPKSFDFWGDYNEAMLSAAREMMVLAIAGWERSKGVQAEIAYATKREIPVSFMSPVDAYYNIKQATK